MLASNRDRMILAGAAALAVAIPVGFVWPVHEPVREVATQVLTPIPVISAKLTGAASKKPLFSPDRKAHDVDAGTDATPGSGAAAPPQLVGIVLGPGRGVALIKLASGETVTAGPGEVAGEWRVDTIGRSQATLSGGGQHLTITLDYRNKPSPTESASPGVPSPPQAIAATQDNP